MWEGPTEQPGRSPPNSSTIYRAFLDQDALVRWLPPEGMTGRLERFDPRVGGGFRMVLNYTGTTGTGKTAPGLDVAETVIVELLPPPVSSGASSSTPMTRRMPAR